MLQSKKANLILALVLAIAFWLYVIGEIDPETSKVYRGVPITIKNEHALKEHGLSVAGLDRQAIAVTVSGNRSNVYKLKKNRIRGSRNPLVKISSRPFTAAFCVYGAKPDLAEKVLLLIFQKKTGFLYCPGKAAL